MINVTVAGVVPVRFAALIVEQKVPVSAGVPLTSPVRLLNASPVGNPAALKVDGTVAVARYRNASPAAPWLEFALVITGDVAHRARQ